MVLVYDEIYDRIVNSEKYNNVYENCKGKCLIEDYKEDNIQSASYDVTIGNEILIQRRDVRTIDLSSETSIKSMFEKIDITEGYVLSPGEYISVQLNEKINMPDDLCAHIRPRTSYNRLGLIITNQHINPSYSGILQLGLKNMTEFSFDIKPELKVGQIVFEKLSAKVKEEKLYRNMVTSKYHNEGRSFVESKVYDDCDKREADEIYKRLLNEKE